jgi:hypothetical protein
MRFMVKRIVGLGASLLFAAACGSNVETNGSTGGGHSSSATGTGGGAPASDVKGTVVYHYHGEAGVLDQPAALTGVQVLAYVMENGAWKPYPGAGHDDGSFTIPDVPAGPFLVDVGGLYLHTTARELDLGADLGGRPDAVVPSNPSLVGGDLQNLSPWSTGDLVEWVSPGAGGVAYGFSNGADLPAGATSIGTLTSDWLGSLVDGNKGDVLYVTQLHMQTAATTYYASVVRFASFENIEQVDGSLTSVMGAFTGVPADQTVTVDIRGSEFAKHGKEVNPGATGAAYDLATAPGAGALGMLGFSADLLDVYPGESDAKVNAQIGNPFPAAWGTTVYAGETFNVDFTAQGATAATSQYGSIIVTAPPDQAAAGPIVPVVTPVLSPTIDGKDAFGAVDGLSLTPTLAWKAPAVGTPSGYGVTVYRLSNVGGASQLDYRAYVATTDTSLTLPPDLLEKGQSYVFVITARVSPIDMASAPNRASPSWASADAITGVATTQ